MLHNNINYYFFLGIGGIGMSALAQYLSTLGYGVYGYDALTSDITLSLEKKGIKIIYEDEPKLLPTVITPDNTLIILTPAIKQSSLLEYFIANHFKIIKRAQLLGQIANHYPLIAVAGTHGKTSTTALISHILYGQNLLRASFVGGVVNNYNSNLIMPKTQPKQGYIVVEADEYDRSFLQLHPNISVITSLEEDHLDIYKDKEDLYHTFKQFLKGSKPNSQIVVNENVDLNRVNTYNLYRYGLDETSDFYAREIKYLEKHQHFSLHFKQHIVKTYINFPGKAYLLNSVAAAAASYLAGVNPDIIANQLKTYLGTKRRFELVYHKKNKYIYDDYAHHPSELLALWDSIKQFFPEDKVTIIFQPHLYSRTRDFAQNFARVLDKFDEPILTDIYAAREKPITEVSVFTILDNMKNTKKKYIPKAELINYLTNSDSKIILIVGAGDINQIIPVFIQKLENK